MADRVHELQPVRQTPVTTGRRHRLLRYSNELGRYALMVLLALVFLLPIAWLFISSVRPAATVFEHTTRPGIRTFVPESLTLENYQVALASPDFRRAIRNSLIVSLSTVLLGVLVNSLAGFAFAVFEFPGRRILFAIVLATFMMPFEAIVIPLYIIIRAFGWTDSFQALILPAVANGLVIFLFRQFLAQIPRDIYEAAKIDGASWIQIYTQIAMPLAWPTIVTASLMLFLQQWDAFFWPLVAASAPEYVVIQVAVARNITYEETHWGTLFSMTSIAVLVPMVFYLFAQRYYMRTIVMSGIK